MKEEFKWADMYGGREHRTPLKAPEPYSPSFKRVVTEWILDWWLEIALLLILVAGVWFIVVLSAQQGVRDQVLLTQCLQDGKKEYECVALLRRPRSTYIPVIIPIR